MGIHDGHRQRMKERFVNYGLDNFDDVNALELLLFYALPRRDTNELAHTLLARFGSLHGVLEASHQELCNVPGIGESAAVLLSLIPAMSRRYMLSKTPKADAVRTPTAAGRFFVPRFMYEREEVVMALFLDARKRPIDCMELERGAVDAVSFNMRRLVSLTLEKKASSLILAHNHLSGEVLPSAEDERATRQLARALSVVGVELDDHIVVAGCEYLSMREAGLF